VKLAIFGLTVSSSWANGHATTWRGVLRALARLGHDVVFFERDVPYYAAARDLPQPSYCRLVLYRDWSEVRAEARSAVADADAAMVTSYCADGVAAGELVLAEARGIRVFYDIDTPITLGDLQRGGFASASGVRYLEAGQVPRYDVYLSFTGGPTLADIKARFGARRVEALYCSVDPELHRPAAARQPRFALGYLGTYAADRQPALERLLLEPARRRPDLSFCVAGSQYPDGVRWPHNVMRLEHLEPERHPEFYGSCRLTLNLTRAAMLELGHSPSVRLFEAAACGTPIVTDRWPGLGDFFEPGREILVADGPADVLRALDRSPAELQAIAAAARRRVQSEHTSEARARRLVEILGSFERVERAS
jgi:spore maturation protein CgeB